MTSLPNHLILIGFKHVGKSVIGKRLSERLNISFIDLDQKIENLYEKKTQKNKTCREIMIEVGEKQFREFETLALTDVMSLKPCIISLGGGTPLSLENQKMITTHTLVHITAPRGIVFERILIRGRPAFFNPEEDLVDSFNRLWDEREKIYKKIENALIENNSSIENAVNQIIKKVIRRGLK